MRDFHQERQVQEDLRADRRHFSRIGAGFLLYNLLATFFLMVALMLVQLSGWNYLPYATEVSRVLSFACMYLLAFPITAAYFRTVPRFGQVRNERWELSAWAVVFLIGVALTYLGNIAGNLVTGFFDVRSESYQGLVDMIWDGSMAFTVLTVVIGAPVVEELLFRKFLVDRVIGYGERYAVLLSGAVFAVMHGNLNQFFYAFALGSLFAYIYCKTGRIRNTILFHMLINFSGGVIVPLLMKGMGDLANIDYLQIAKIPWLFQQEPVQALCLLLAAGYSMAQFLAALVGLILLALFKKYICFYPGIRRLSAGQLVYVTLANAGMLVFLLLCLLSFSS